MQRDSNHIHADCNFHISTEALLQISAHQTVPHHCLPEFKQKTSQHHLLIQLLQRRFERGDKRWSVGICLRSDSWKEEWWWRRFCRSWCKHSIIWWCTISPHVVWSWWGNDFIFSRMSEALSKKRKAAVLHDGLSRQVLSMCPLISLERVSQGKQWPLFLLLHLGCLYCLLSYKTEDTGDSSS